MEIRFSCPNKQAQHRARTAPDTRVRPMSGRVRAAKDRGEPCPRLEPDRTGQQLASVHWQQPGMQLDRESRSSGTWSPAAGADMLSHAARYPSLLLLVPSNASAEEDDGGSLRCVARGGGRTAVAGTAAGEAAAAATEWPCRDSNGCACLQGSNVQQLVHLWRWSSLPGVGRGSTDPSWIVLLRI